MHLITTADEELFGLVSTAAKLGKAEKLLARLANERQADPDDPDAGFRYALALMAALSGVGAELEAHARFTTTVEALGEVLLLNPEHWLARYSRARLQALVPGAYGAMFPSPVSTEFDSREDLDHLFAHQARSPQQPYFASTYALTLVVEELLDNQAPDRTKNPDRRASLFAGLAACPRVPVRLPKLGAVLCEPLVALHHRCDGADRQTVGEVMSALYGDQPAVLDVRPRQPVR